MPAIRRCGRCSTRPSAATSSSSRSIRSSATKSRARRRTSPTASNEITFNASLLAELRAADFVARLIRSGILNSDGYRLERLHRIGGAGRLESFPASTKFDVSWPFLRELRDLGRADTKAWLKANFDAIGVEGTLDIDRALEREPAKDPVRGAPAAG